MHWVCWDCFLGVDFTQIIQHSFGLFAWDLVEKVPKTDLGLFFTIVWGLWNKRIFSIHNGEILDPWLVVDEAGTLI